MGRRYNNSATTSAKTTSPPKTIIVQIISARQTLNTIGIMHLDTSLI